LDTGAVVEVRAPGVISRRGKRVALREVTMRSGRRLYHFVKYIEASEPER
jgi:hypothetical protein